MNRVTYCTNTGVSFLRNLVDGFSLEGLRLNFDHYIQPDTTCRWLQRKAQSTFSQVEFIPRGQVQLLHLVKHIIQMLTRVRTGIKWVNIDPIGLINRYIHARGMSRGIFTGLSRVRAQCLTLRLII